jgi:DNA repair protein RecN (Recombination protein N)
MLTALSIRNIVLIDRLDVAFAEGLSVLTGETGAGKSILLDALGMALGARSEGRMLRAGVDRGSVTATFQVPEGHPLVDLLRNQDLPADSTIMLRRVLSDDGRTRAYVNDEAISIGLLRQLGDSLIEIQGQFDERGLLDRGTHRTLLDIHGKHAKKKSDLATAFKEWREAEESRRQAESDAAQSREDEDYLRHSLSELENIDPVPGEEQQLADNRTMLQNAEAVLAGLDAAYAELAGDSGAESRLQSAVGQLARTAEKAAGRLDPVTAALDRAVAEIQDAMQSLREVANDLNLDRGDLESIEERLFALRDAARKHGIRVDDLPLLQERLTKRLSMLDDQTGTIATLKKEEEQVRNRYVAGAKALSAARRKAAKKLDTTVNAELPPLKLDKAKFATLIESLDEGSWTADGMDRVSFQISTNPGAAMGPLSQIASGGELSRFLLALKVALAETGPTPTLVFDEVDSGVGGATADAVGERLLRLSQNLQVLVVTHSPQVAARGDTHLRVEKLEAGNVAVTRVDQLEMEERREEVARMLSGREITDEARAAATRLLEGERV